eukprot:TRINITY_DN29688_c0_g1_i2.p1 TRINITY_DN29688_c0_g1~~TRINITY_DN29688_c0_g1_i2.p1  ORF type:complete len:100 (-),score=39.94 TRINITY_DN29688_c0_g1_i2:100-399(-)
MSSWELSIFFFFFQAEDGIRDAQESRGLGDVYKRQAGSPVTRRRNKSLKLGNLTAPLTEPTDNALTTICLLYTSDAADEEDSVDLGGRRIIKKKKKIDL